MSRTRAPWEPAFVFSESGVFRLVSWARVFCSCVWKIFPLMIYIDIMFHSQINFDYDCIYIFREIVSNTFDVD